MPTSRRIFRGILHTILGSYFGKAVNFVSTILLTRILLPEDFGIVAMGLFLASSAGLVKEFGFDFALIHKQDDTERASVTHFYLSVISSLFAFLITAVLFFILRGRYESRVLAAMLALSAVFLFRSLGSTSRVLLEKDLRFSLLAWVDMTSNIFTLVLAVILALLGFGFWSIVIAGSANSFSYILLTSTRYWKEHPVVFKGSRLDANTARWFFSYGKWMLLCTAGIVVTLQFDSFIAGTLLGVAALGFYERAYRFSQYPTDAITHVVSRVAMSIYAKYQDDKSELSNYFSFFLAVIVRVAFPLSAVIFIFADEMVRVILGDRWLPIVTTLRLLIVYSLSRPILDDTGAFFTAIGRPRIISIIFLIQGAAMILIATVLTYYFGITGTAVSANVVMLIGVAIVYHKISEYISVPYSKIFITPSVCIIIGYLCYAFTFKYLLAVQSDTVRLAAGVMIFLFFYGASLAFLEREQTARYFRYFRESMVKPGEL